MQGDRKRERVQDTFKGSNDINCTLYTLSIQVSWQSREKVRYNEMKENGHKNRHSWGGGGEAMREKERLD